MSKDFLLGTKTFDRLLIKAPDYWGAQNIDCLRQTRIDYVDPAAKVVRSTTGNVIGYEKLVWATGGEPRPLSCPGYDLGGVHTIRTRGDVDHILAALPHVERVVVVGGGYIGLEAASVFRKLGKQVVVLEAMDRVLSRVAGDALSRFFEDEHRAQGVEVRLETTLTECVGADGIVNAVVLDDGTRLPTDLVIVGIGIIPAVAPLIAAGAQGTNGVLVGPHCQTSLHDIYAIGDCAAHANRFAGGEVVRLESVQNARDQATVVAKTICGVKVHYDAVPWFWSDQFDLKLQTAGLSMGYDDTVLRGDPAARVFSVIYLRQGQIIAIDSVNAPADHMAGRRFVAGQVAAPRTALADVEQPLKDLL